MGFRRRAEIRSWAESLVDEHGPTVAQIVGLVPPLPRVTIRVVRGAEHPGTCLGTTITLDEHWFSEHPEDAGAVVHELSHAYLQCAVQSPSTSWLIEGIGDFTRNQVGLETSWSRAHFAPGCATAGYQTSAHFLHWVEDWHPGTVVTLAGRLRRGTYDSTSFSTNGRPLAQLVWEYESLQH